MELEYCRFVESLGKCPRQGCWNAPRVKDKDQCVMHENCGRIKCGVRGCLNHVLVNDGEYAEFCDVHSCCHQHSFHKRCGERTARRKRFCEKHLAEHMDKGGGASLRGQRYQSPVRQSQCSCFNRMIMTVNQ